MAPTYGFQGQLGISANNPVDVRYDFVSEHLALDETFLDLAGLRGTLARPVERERQGNRRVSGPIVLEPTAVELAAILPWLMGGTPSGSGTVTYPLADSLVDRYITVDRGSKVFTYNGCRPASWTLHGTQGEPLRLTINVVGKDETPGNSGTFPSLSLDTSTAPFIFTDLALVINSVTVQCPEFEVSCDWGVDTNRFFNSQTATALIATDRHIKVNTRLPYGDDSTSYNLGVAGVAGTATFTGAGTAVLTMTFASLIFPRKSPTVGGRQEVLLPLQGEAKKTGSTLELVTQLHV